MAEAERHADESRIIAEGVDEEPVEKNRRSFTDWRLWLVAGAATLYALFGGVPFVQALFLGIQATVVVIVAQALWKVAGKALTAPVAWALAGASFLGIFVFAIPFPAIILAAAAVGALALAGEAAAPVARPRARGGLGVLAAGLVLWFAPLGLVAALDQALLAQVGLFFAKLAVVTFGGAYAVLAYMTQEVVQDFGWLTTAQMMDALGLAETTPGPLILVTQFVGFLAGAAEGGLGLAFAAGALALWMTFVPCFIWIFLGAPWLDWIAAQPRLTGALRGITAAVVGVILNLGLWFAAHVAFAEVGLVTAGPVRMIAPDPATLSLAAVALSLVAAGLLLRLKLSLPLTLAMLAALGGGLSLLPGAPFLS